MFTYFVTPALADTSYEVNPASDVSVGWNTNPRGCALVGTMSVTDYSINGASMSFRACRGDAAGCAAGGGNWCSTLICCDGCALTDANCHEFFAGINYGSYTETGLHDVSEIVTAAGDYDVYICERSAAGNPCCYDFDGTGDCWDGCWDGHADCGVGCSKYTGLYAWCHADWIKLEVLSTSPDEDQTVCESNPLWTWTSTPNPYEVGTPSCCGNDAGENRVIEYENTDPTNDVAFVNGEYGCCDDTKDCVSAQGPQGCYPSTTDPLDASTVDVNPGGNDTKILCYRGGLHGEWADCDNDDWMDWWCGDICGPAKGKIGTRSGTYSPNPNWNAVISGEPWIGEYTLTDYTNRKLECCGDDTGENYVDSTGLGATPISANRACCNDSSDFVWITGVTKYCCNPAAGEGNTTAGCGTCTDGIDNDGDDTFDESGANPDRDCVHCAACMDVGGFWDGDCPPPFGDPDNFTVLGIDFFGPTNPLCCGDEVNEYISRPHILYSVDDWGSACHASLENTFCTLPDDSDWGCCGDETNCFDGVGTCHANLGRFDVDGDSDSDACINEGAHGFWVDCIDGTDCPAGEFCGNYDCIEGSGWLDVGNNSLNDSNLPGVSDDFGGSINYILRHGCTCEGCVIEDGDCIIPMIFHLTEPPGETLDLRFSSSGLGLGVLVSAGVYKQDVPYGEVFESNKNRDITIDGVGDYCLPAGSQTQFNPLTGACALPTDNSRIDCTGAFINAIDPTDSATDDALWRLWRKAAGCSPGPANDPWDDPGFELTKLTIGFESRPMAPKLFGPVPLKLTVWV
ncbi:MAG: hypothetical protein ABH950_02515 [Candidatus Altiarchaeota archaeon]